LAQAQTKVVETSNSEYDYSVTSIIAQTFFPALAVLATSVIGAMILPNLFGH